MNSTINRDVPGDIVILGASGDLCKRKLMPALYDLYKHNLLPHEFRIFGFARSSLSNTNFRDRIRPFLRNGKEDSSEKGAAFLSRCFYFSGDYDTVEDFCTFETFIKDNGGFLGNRLFYLSIPPSVFLPSALSIGESGLMNVDTAHWARVVIEKPFGRDSESSKLLNEQLSTIFTDEQVYRIDHYLGKEVIQNLMILRFANLVLEPLWNRHYIRQVSISFSENLGLEGRVGYFDNYGITRDVMQNHLMQIMALVAMEEPVKLTAKDVAAEKVKVLRSVAPLTLSDVLTGQYTAGEIAGVRKPGYLEEPGVPSDSLTETYSRAIVHINNHRWSGVPFILSAGKALDTSKTEIIVGFHEVPHSLYGKNSCSCLRCANDLHIRVQPDEAIELHLANKVPGMTNEMKLVKLNMLYKSTFEDEAPDAYERLLFDVMRGDHTLFIQEEELAVSWDIVTPVLHELAEKQVKPQPYTYGSAGPMAKTPDNT